MPKIDLDEIIKKHETKEINPKIAEMNFSLGIKEINKGNNIKAAEYFQIANNFDPKKENIEKRNEEINNSKREFIRSKPYIGRKLSSLCSEWADKKGKDPREAYIYAVSLVKDVYFTLDDIIDFSRGHAYAGEFLSAMINQVIKPGETIRLKPIKGYASHLGSFHERGNLILKLEPSPKTRYNIGYAIRGGKVTVEAGDGLVLDYGMCMEGGELIIKGDIKDPYGPFGVGEKQKGGKILVKGDVYCSVAKDALPGSKIEIEGSVYGIVASSWGTDILIHGDVHNAVACFTMEKTKDKRFGKHYHYFGIASHDMPGFINCTIKGNVYGDVAHVFGITQNENRKRGGKIEIFGDVDGEIGTIGPESEVIVHGNVREIDEVWGGIVRVGGKIEKMHYCYDGGKVYQNGKDVSKVTLSTKIARFFEA